MRASNTSEFYKGKRKKTGPTIVVSIIVLALIAFVVLLFYGLQKYIVVTTDGIHLEMPLLMSGESSQNEDSAIVRSFEKVDAELVMGEADYSNVAPTAGENLKEVRAVCVSAASVSQAGVESAVAGMGDAGAIVLDVKTASGQLLWNSSTEIAQGYGTSGSTDLKSIVSYLKEKDIYAVARICCLADSLLASRYDDICLKTVSGVSYADGSGAWLDPYCSQVKNYIIGLCKELDTMGFDEIILMGLRLPTAPAGYEFAFHSKTSSEPTPITAVSGFALDVSRALKGCTAKISVQLAGDTAYTAGEDSVTGQSAELFYKLFDRIYISCKTDAASDIVSGCEKYVSLGDAGLRTVPICSGDAPMTNCWVMQK